MTYTIPNILTLARLILLVPICLLMMGGAFAHVLAFLLYLLAAATDWLDGWWARTYNQGSEFGRIFDPIADKIFVAALFLMLASNHAISGIWLFCPIIILGREFLVSGLREYLGAKGGALPVTDLAKWKTGTQMTAIGMLILSFIPGFVSLGTLLLLAATVMTVMTGMDYMKSAELGKKPAQPESP